MGDLTGTPMNCLIEPMTALCEMADRTGVRLVVFVDAAYLLRLKELSKKVAAVGKHYKLVISDIEKLSRQGHDIQFHFHPQWLYSDYNEKEGRWIVDRNHYKLSDMPPEDINLYFSNSKKLLDSISGQISIAFRAGGYSLTSLDNYYELLYDNDIRIDSSVNSRRKVDGQYQTYDYSKTPILSEWCFKHGIDNVVNEGGIIEIPISYTKSYPGIIYLYKKRKLQRKFGKDKRWFTGTGQTSFLSRRKRWLFQIRKFVNGMSFTANADSFMSLNLMELYQMFKKNNQKNMVIIGHPKNASPESIKNLESFILSIKNDDRVITFSEYYKSKCH